MLEVDNRNFDRNFHTEIINISLTLGNIVFHHKRLLLHTSAYVSIRRHIDIFLSLGNTVLHHIRLAQRGENRWV